MISQLQDQTNHMASLLFNHIGGLQRDAPPVQLRRAGSDAKQELCKPSAETEEQAKSMAVAFVHSAKLFDAIVDSIPVDESEEMQLQKITELQAKNAALGEELAAELSLVEEEMQSARTLFHSTADECLGTSSPS